MPYIDPDFGFVKLQAVELLETRPDWVVNPFNMTYKFSRNLERLRVKSAADVRFFTGTMHAGDAERYPNWQALNKLNKQRYAYEPPTQLTDADFDRALAKRKAALKTQSPHTPEPDEDVIVHDETPKQPATPAARIEEPAPKKVVRRKK